MLTYTSRRNIAGDLAGDSSSGTLSIFDTLMNQSERKILSSRRWPFLMRSFTDTTVASTQFYQMRANIGRIFSVYITSGTTRHIPREAPSREFWEQLNESTSYTSDWPEWWYQFDGQYGFWPTPASSSLTITVNGLRRYKDLTLADYTTGTVDIITNADETVVGSGTTWTSPMAGRWLKVTESNTATAAGDERWYEIDSVTDTTNLELVKKYEGTSLTTGAAAAYTIGQVGLLPEDYQLLPVYDALRHYFGSIKPEPRRAAFYDNLFKEDYRNLTANWGSASKNPTLDRGDETRPLNPNLTVTL